MRFDRTPHRRRVCLREKQLANAGKALRQALPQDRREHGSLFPQTLHRVSSPLCSLGSTLPRRQVFRKKSLFTQFLNNNSTSTPTLGTIARTHTGFTFSLNSFSTRTFMIPRPKTDCVPTGRECTLRGDTRELRNSSAKKIKLLHA